MTAARIGAVAWRAFLIALLAAWLIAGETIQFATDPWHHLILVVIAAGIGIRLGRDW